MRGARFGDRVRYRFDNLMARGPLPLLGLLILIDVVLGLVAAGVVQLLRVVPEEQPGESLGYGQLLYRTLLHTIEPAVLGEDKGSGLFVAAMVILTIAGIFVFGSVVGVITTGIDRQLEHLRRGRSLVVERDHTLIYGWSTQILTIISELLDAQEDGRRRAIVVVAERDKLEMDSDIKRHLRKRRGGRVITRHGDPLDHADLELGNPQRARSIIVLPPDRGDADTQVIKTVLALTNDPERRPEPYHIVTQLRHRASVEVAREASRGEAKLILDDLTITRITAQTCRQSGLSIVYTELLDFAGDEIYFREVPSLVGRTFKEALFEFESAAVIGYARPGSRPLLNPPAGTRLQEGDQIVYVATTGNPGALGGASAARIDEAAIVSAPSRPRVPERTLVLGWNSDRGTFLTELDSYVSSGSEVVVASADPGAEAGVQAEGRRLSNQKVTFRHADPTDRQVLKELDVAGFDHVVVLSDSDRFPPQVADSRTLMTLLHLRSLEEETGKDFQIVSEMLDLRNRRLAEVTRADDFIVSDHLVSLLTAQISENPMLADLFEDLFKPDGSEVYLRPAEDYVGVDQKVSYATVVEAASRRGETAIGYRLHSHDQDAAHGYGVRINPPKSAQVAFRPGDRVVVLAED